MKHFYLCLPLLFGAIGCAPAASTLKLHHEAKAYIGSTKEEDTLPTPVSLSLSPDTFYDRVGLNAKLATYENGGK